MVVHGDDFVSEWPNSELLWFDQALGENFQIKTEILGPDAGETRELRVFNRVIRWEDQGVSWEADPRHAELIVDQLGLIEEGARAVSTPGVKAEGAKDQTEDARSGTKVEKRVKFEDESGDNRCS